MPQVGATYSVGPGVNIAGLVQQTPYDPNGAYAPTSASFTPGPGGAPTNNNGYATVVIGPGAVWPIKY